MQRELSFPDLPIGQLPPDVQAVYDAPPVVEPTPQDRERDRYHAKRQQRAVERYRRRRVKPAVDPRVDSYAVKVSRNDPCPCGSGLKHKHCHRA